MTATQNTVGMLSAESHMTTIASSGPRKAPTVSSDWRRPKLAPRSSGGAMSATSASRGAPRMPLPTRSMKRAATSQPTERRQREDRLGEGGQAVAECGQEFPLAEPVGQGAGEDLGDRGGRLGDAFDDADGQRRGAENGDEIDRQERVDHLRGDVHEQRDEAEHPDAGRDRLANADRTARHFVALVAFSPGNEGTADPRAHLPTPAAAEPSRPDAAGVISPGRRFRGTPSPSP